MDPTLRDVTLRQLLTHRAGVAKFTLARDSRPCRTGRERPNSVAPRSPGGCCAGRRPLRSGGSPTPTPATRSRHAWPPRSVDGPGGGSSVTRFSGRSACARGSAGPPTGRASHGVTGWYAAGSTRHHRTPTGYRTWSPPQLTSRCTHLATSASSSCICAACEDTAPGCCGRARSASCIGPSVATRWGGYAGASTA
jgi:hypothetical protein